MRILPTAFAFAVCLHLSSTIRPTLQPGLRDTACGASLAPGLAGGGRWERTGRRRAAIAAHGPVPAVVALRGGVNLDDIGFDGNDGFPESSGDYDAKWMAEVRPATPSLHWRRSLLTRRRRTTTTTGMEPQILAIS